MDSIRILSNYEIQLINLNESSLNYWYETALKLDSLLAYEQQKVKVYAKITGFEHKSVTQLGESLLNKQAIDQEIMLKYKEDGDLLRKQNRTLKIKNTVLEIGVGLLIFETAYLLITN